MDGIYAMPERILAIGDVHGDIERLKRCLRAHGVVNDEYNWIAGDTHLVQLGDQIDSANRDSSFGEWETAPDLEVILFTDDLDMQAHRVGGRVISLIGNHEIMNRFEMGEYISKRSMDASGGPLVRMARFSSGGDIAEILARRPAIVKIGNIIFCHAAILPHHLDLIGNDNECIAIINEMMHRFFRGQPVPQSIFGPLFLNQEGLLWSRIYSSVDEEELNLIAKAVFKRIGGTNIVVGHTPIDHIVSRAQGQVWFIDTRLSRSFGENQVQILEIKI